MDDRNHHHPQEHSSAGRNHANVAVDLRRGHVRATTLPGQADLRDRVQEARREQQAAGVRLLSSRG